jgi:hypothetical protein
VVAAWLLLREVERQPIVGRRDASSLFGLPHHCKRRAASELDDERVSARTLGPAVLLPDREATAAVTGAGDDVIDGLPTHRDVVV